MNRDFILSPSPETGGQPVVGFAHLLIGNCPSYVGAVSFTRNLKTHITLKFAKSYDCETLK